MLRLKALGWGSKWIAAELGCARNPVWLWVTAGDWRACASGCQTATGSTQGLILHDAKALCHRGRVYVQLARLIP
jgi:hypothetical protein